MEKKEKKEVGYATKEEAMKVSDAATAQNLVATQKKQYNKLVGLINKEMSKMQTSSLKIAFILHEIYKDKLYDYDGYKNIYEFGEDRFDLSRGSVSCAINIVERFALRDESGEILAGNEAKLKEDYEKFTYSKLCILVSVPDEYLSEFYSSMTAKEMRGQKADIAKRIEENKDENLLPDSDSDSINEETMNPPEGDSEQNDSDNDGESVEEMGKHCYINIASYPTLDELIKGFSDTAFMKLLTAQMDAFIKELPDNVIPKVSIGLSYDN